MRRLWLISTGEYSDYSPELLAESKEQAEAIADYLNGSSSNWREYQVDGPLRVLEEGDPLPQQVASWRALIEDDQPPKTWVSKWKWDFQQGQPVVQSGGNAQSRRWAAYSYPTEEAAVQAVQELKAAEEAKEQQ